MDDVGTDHHGHDITPSGGQILIMQRRGVYDDHDSGNDGVEHSEPIV